MLETQQTFQIEAPLEDVWAYVSKIGNWASSMPGYQFFEEIDDRRSKWEFKVALGALSRRVRLEVEIVEWHEPDRIAFTMTGVGDPITGKGTFDARAEGGVTGVEFVFSIAGSGPMAPTMEAMSRPVVPRMGAEIAETLKREIEGAEPAPAPARRPNLLARLWQRLRNRRIDATGRSADPLAPHDHG